MTHAHAPLTPTGRLRMVHRHLHDGIPQAHVAAEFRVSRPTVVTWVARYRAEGEAALADRSSRPRRSPDQLDPALVDQIHALRQERKWSARRIHHHLHAEGHQLCLRTVGRWLHRAGISRLRNLTPAGEDLRQPPQKITARAPGHMVHLDVKEIGRIPEGGGWRAHGRNSEAGRAAKRGAGARVGCTSLHSAIDGHTRLAYTEALEDERAVTTIGFYCRARVFFAGHGISIDRVITDNFEQLPGRRFHHEGGLPGWPAPPDPPVHPEAQRQGGEGQPVDGGRGPLRPLLRLRHPAA